MLKYDTKAVLNADSWCEVPMSSIIVLLQQDELNVNSEITLLSACVRWAQHQLDIKTTRDLNKQQSEATSNSLKDCEIQLHINNQNLNNAAIDFKEDNINNEDNEERSIKKRRINKEDNVNKDESDCKVTENGDSELRKYLDSFLPHIRILSLTPQEFVQATDERSGIFSDEEILQILRCIASRSRNKHKMPAGLCKIKLARICAVVNFTDVAKADQDLIDTMKPELDLNLLKE
jgi:hypothetical protein